MLHTLGNTDCSPAEVGYDASRIGVLHSHFQNLIDDKKIQAASYCVSRYGKTFMHGAIGPARTVRTGRNRFYRQRSIISHPLPKPLPQ